MAALVALVACAGSEVALEPPEPTFPSAERVEELVLSGDRFLLPGTLELPASTAPVPCAVFFAGSGPTDRDWRSRLTDGEPAGRQLAAALRREGIGSLRFDKVGSPNNRSAIGRLSLDHYRDEGVLAFEFLDDLDECDRVFTLGTSEGAIHAVRTAAIKRGDPTLGGVIALDPPAKPLIDALLDQIWADQLRRDPAVDRERLAQLLSDFRHAARTDAAYAEVAGIGALARLWRSLDHPANPRVARQLLFVDPLAVARRYDGSALVVSTRGREPAFAGALGRPAAGAVRRVEQVVGDRLSAAIAAFVRVASR